MEIELLFMPFLKGDEKILWTGKPRSGIQLRDADIILIPASIILLGFSVVLDYVLYHFESPIVFKIIGILFAVAGVYIGCIRYLLDASHRKNSFYCITNKRILAISGKKKQLKTLPIKNIAELDKTEEKDGSGFIIFGSTNPLWPWLFGKFYMSGDTLPGLEMLPDVNKVYDLLESRIKIEVSQVLKDQLSTLKKHDFN